MNIDSLQKAFEHFGAPLPSSMEVCEFIINNTEETDLFTIVNKVITFEELMHRNASLSDVKRFYKTNLRGE